ncbi:hypothetical protein EDC04DRAFT_2902068 [Pisolithus marmoratus]|nr:hypothetical protein EDC04DRAFT_2902068 [Pisolithus marmoratus]
MARTKQTARKVTGGHAARINLHVLQKKRGKAKLAAQKPSPKLQAMTNSLCVMCRDGGDVWICDEEECGRVVCYRCLVVPEDSMEKVRGSDVKFRCVTCHWQKTKGNPQPYFAFYSKGETILSDPPLLLGGFQHSITSQVASLPAALVHLHLEALEVGHSQVKMLHSFLENYFPKGGYKFSQLGFDLATPESMEVYEKAASNLAQSLSPYSRVVLIITTHSDEERGDLFAGLLHGEAVSSKVLEVLEISQTHQLTPSFKGWPSSSQVGHSLPREGEPSPSQVSQPHFQGGVWAIPHPGQPTPLSGGWAIPYPSQLTPLSGG